MKRHSCAFFVVPICNDGRKKCKRKKVKVQLTITIEKVKIKGKIMAISLRDTQVAEVELSVVDKKGYPAQVDEGSVQYTSSDESVFRVEEDPDNELRAKIVAVAPGVAQLNYTADADLEDGITSIDGFTAVEVLPGDAVGFGVRIVNVSEQEETSSSTTSTTTEESTTSSTTETTTEPSTTETTTEASTTETTTEASTTETTSSTTEETTATTEETTATTEETTLPVPPEEPVI
jgi:hypothetical protein